MRNISGSALGSCSNRARSADASANWDAEDDLDRIRRAILRMLDLHLPAVCDISITNVCNAACDFCGFAREKTLHYHNEAGVGTVVAMMLPCALAVTAVWIVLFLGIPFGFGRREADFLTRG
jgi:hypothetical protein